MSENDSVDMYSAELVSEPSALDKLAEAILEGRVSVVATPMIRSRTRYDINVTPKAGE